MDFITIAKQRMSVRDYKETKVEPEKLEQILEAAHVAPTAANLQPIRLIAVQSEEGLAKIGKAANIYGAPLAIIVCADHDKAWVRPFDQKQTGDIDASILTDHMMLQATELGLGTVWVCYFDPAVLRKEFDLPANLEPVNILVIGYSNEGTGDPNRFNKQRIPMSQLNTRAAPAKQHRGCVFIFLKYEHRFLQESTGYVHPARNRSRFSQPCVIALTGQSEAHEAGGIWPIL